MELLLMVVVAAVVMVLPFAVVYWLWVRRVFVVWVRVAWTVAVLVIPIPAIPLAVLCHLVPQMLARRRSRTAAPTVAE